MTAKWNGVFWGVIKIDCGDGCTTLSILKPNELYTCMNCIVGANYINKVVFLKRNFPKITRSLVAERGLEHIHTFDSESSVLFSIRAGPSSTITKCHLEACSGPSQLVSSRNQPVTLCGPIMAPACIFQDISCYYPPSTLALFLPLQKSKILCLPQGLCICSSSSPKPFYPRS